MIPGDQVMPDARNTHQFFIAAANLVVYSVAAAAADNLIFIGTDYQNRMDKVFEPFFGMFQQGSDLINSGYRISVVIDLPVFRDEIDELLAFSIAFPT